MRYDFSSEFIRILPPDTSFAEAWESLCEILLRAELDSSKLIRLRPPDRGVDILYRRSNKAFQCKSSERGAYGRIDAEESAKSLETAIKHKLALGWRQYSFATNAEYTGAGYEKILTRAKQNGLSAKQLEFLGPTYWDQMCVNHAKLVEDRFDYRIRIGERDLSEALQEILFQKRDAVSVPPQTSEKRIVITNNLTQLELEHDLIEGLSVETYLKVIMELLGLSEFLRGSNAHYETFRPLFSLRAGGTELSLMLRLRDLNIKSGDKLEFHTKLNDEALAAFEQIIAQSPENATTQRARAGLLRSMGRLDEALTVYQIILAEHPDDLTTKTEYAETLKVQGRFDAALAIYDGLLAAYGEDVVVRNGRAEVLKQMGQFAHALSAYDSRVEVSSNEVDSTEARGKEPEETDRKLPNERDREAWEVEELVQGLIWQTAKKRRSKKVSDVRHSGPHALAA